MGLGGRIGRGTALAGLAVALLLPPGCGRKDRRPLTGVPVMRVRLMQDQQQVTLTASRNPTLWPDSPRAQPLQLPPNAPVPVQLTLAGWRIGDSTLGSAGELTIQPDGDGTLQVNGTTYRGRYRLVPVAGADGRFDVINDVNLDGYLKSVVSKELLPGWQPQAFRAQAIVARTYALHTWAVNNGRGSFDLNDDVRSQVYGGLSAESAKSRAAVEATRGVVLSHPTADGNKVFKAYFSACCGGITQSAQDAFNEPNIKPLSARYVGPQCSQSPHFNWGPVVVPKSELTRRMRLWAQNRDHPLKQMAEVANIDVWKPNEFGRPARFVVIDARGVQYAMTSEEIRWAVNTGGNTLLKSGFFRPVDEGTSIRFAEGHGLGHGVGMCQWCAESQAEDGMRGEDIALKSFPGTKLVRAY
jgi:stage II sporulation protein D